MLITLVMFFLFLISSASGSHERMRSFLSLQATGGCVQSSTVGAI